MSSGEVIPYTGIINAGGLGSRAPKDVIPPGVNDGTLKALFPVGDPQTTLIDHHIQYHLDSGATSVIASVGSHQDVTVHIDSRYGDNEKVHSFQVERALGIGGDILQMLRRQEIAQHIGSLVVITNVDTIADVDVQELLAFHRDTEAEMSIALSTLRDVPHEGQYLVGENNRVTYCGECQEGSRMNQFAEIGEDKLPLWSWKGSSTGVVVVNRDLLANYPWSPTNGSLSLYTDMVSFVLRQGQMAAFNNSNRFFMDLGTPESWQRAQEPGLLQPYLH